MSEWQDIETAPKDGTRILIVVSGSYVMEASWHSDWYGDDTISGFMGANLDEEYGSFVQASHWQPLPPPPIKG